MYFPLAKFRLLYSVFDSEGDETVNAVAEQASCLADTQGCKCSEQAWMALVAHLLFLRQAAANGNTQTGAVTSATIDKVSVSFAQAPTTDNWSHWLNLSPYGQQALAFLNACNGVGSYVGGLPERDAYTGVYGVRGGFR